MRRRRKKVAKANGSDGKGRATDNDDNVSGQKRSANEMSNNDAQISKKARSDNELPTTIIVPANLTTQEAKKFRKDARRKARAQGQSADDLKFIVEGQEPIEEQNEDKSKGGKKKSKKKEFPRINDILSTHASQKKLQEKLEKRNAINSAIPLVEKQRYVAVDCEMVGIGTDGVKSALARASVTNWDGEVLLDTFVRVPERVTDFRTHVSGVRSKDIHAKNENAMDHEECRLKVGELLMGKILVGHALKNDLSALMISHPRGEIRDTARYKPFMRATGRSGGKLRPRKLRDLVYENLGMRIQVEGEAHSSIDDARASMELYKFARNRWEKELEKGTKRGKK